MGAESVVSYRRKEAVFSQGEPADAVFYPSEGRGEVDRGLQAREGSGGWNRQS